MSDLAKRFKVGVLALSGAGLIAIANFEGFEEKLIFLSREMIQPSVLDIKMSGCLLIRLSLCRML